MDTEPKDTTWDILRGVAAERPADVEALVKSAILDRVYDKIAAQREDTAKTVFKDKEPEETAVEEASNNPFHPESPEGRAWEEGDRSSIEPKK